MVIALETFAIKMLNFKFISQNSSIFLRIKPEIRVTYILQVTSGNDSLNRIMSTSKVQSIES